MKMEGKERKERAKGEKSEGRGVYVLKIAKHTLPSNQPAFTVLVRMAGRRAKAGSLNMVRPFACDGY
jgi:hypothetical protein